MFNCAGRYSYSNMFSSTHKKRGTGESKGRNGKERERKKKGRERRKEGRWRGRPRLRDWGRRGKEEGAIVGTLLNSL